MRDPYEYEEEQLCQELNNGTITEKEFNESMRDLMNQHRADREEYANDAYNRAMDEF